MDKPHPIQGYAILKKQKPKISPQDIFTKKNIKDIYVLKDERKCIVEIKFVKWTK